MDVSQEVIVRADDCGTELGIYQEEIRDGNEVVEPLNLRIYGRFALEDILYPESHPKAGEDRYTWTDKGNGIKYGVLTETLTPDDNA